MFLLRSAAPLSSAEILVLDRVSESVLMLKSSAGYSSLSRLGTKLAPLGCELVSLLVSSSVCGLGLSRGYCSVGFFRIAATMRVRIRGSGWSGLAKRGCIHDFEDGLVYRTLDDVSMHVGDFARSLGSDSCKPERWQPRRVSFRLFSVVLLKKQISWAKLARVACQVPLMVLRFSERRNAACSLVWKCSNGVECCHC